MTDKKREHKDADAIAEEADDDFEWSERNYPGRGTLAGGLRQQSQVDDKFAPDRLGRDKASQQSSEDEDDDDDDAGKKKSN